MHMQLCVHIFQHTVVSFTNAMHIILDYKMSNQHIVCMYMHYQTFIALAIALAIVLAIVLAARSSSEIATMQLSLKYSLYATITCKQCYFLSFHCTFHMFSRVHDGYR